jgi:replicative DNA helicase
LLEFDNHPLKDQMATEEQNLPPEFILEMFRLALHDKYTQQIVASKIKQNWLLAEEERDFLTELKLQVQAENRNPTFGTMLLAAKANKNEELRKYIGLVRETELREPATILSSLESFIKQAIFVETYDATAVFYNRKQRKKAYEIFARGAEALNNFSLTTDLFEPVFGNFPQRNTQRVIENSKGHEPLPFGIDGIDYIFNGFQRKEYVLFLAGSKGTKSYCMNHAGVNYARRGYGVAHFQLEGTKKQCMDRYDAAWLGSSYKEIKAGEVTEEKFKSFRKIVENIGKGEIFVYAPERYNAMTMLDVRRMVIDLKRQYDIAVVIIDYLDLCSPDDERYGVNDERLKKQRTSRAMKNLAMETDTLVVSNTQSNSVSYELLNDADFVLRRENLSEDRGTIQATDFLITINRTKDERDQGMARLFIDGARDYKSDQIIQIYQNLAKARFYDRVKTVKNGYWNDEEIE